MKAIPLLALTSVLVFGFVPVAHGSDNSAAISRLCQALKERKQLLIEKDQSEVYWSDGAMFEVAPKLPAPLQQLLASAKDNPTLKLMLARMSRDLGPDWKDASVSRSPKGDAFRTVKSADGTVSLTVSSAYIDYLKERYPKARIRAKGELNPVLFQIGESVRAAVMAIKS